MYIMGGGVDAGGVRSIQMCALLKYVLDGWIGFGLAAKSDIFHF